MEDRGSRGAGPLVIRPDSGDPPTVVCKVLEILGGQVVCVYVSETHAKTLNKIEFRKHVTKKISGAFQPWSPIGRKSHISVSTYICGCQRTPEVEMSPCLSFLAIRIIEEDRSITVETSTRFHPPSSWYQTTAYPTCFSQLRSPRFIRISSTNLVLSLPSLAVFRPYRSSSFRTPSAVISLLILLDLRKLRRKYHSDRKPSSVCAWK